jgi:hypothetical protein
MSGFPVGSVVRVAGAAANEYYVLLARGLQRIGVVTAELIRFTDSQNNRDIATVAPDVIGAVPILDTLRVSTFPERGGVSGEAIVCARWQFGAAGANIAVVVGNSMPVGGSDSMMPALPAAGTRRWPTTFRPPHYCPKEVHTEYAAGALP